MPKIKLEKNCLMAKKTYRFNTEKLQYELIKPTLKSLLIRFVPTLILGLVFSAAVLTIAYTFFSSPKELIQAREIEQFKLQYDILQDRIARIEKVAKDLQERDDNIYRVIFEAEPVSSEIREAGMGGSDRYSKLKGYKNSDLVMNTTKMIDDLSNKLVVQSKSYDEVFELAKNKEEMLACIPAIQPISDKYKGRISAFYGYRIHPIYKTKIFHEGVDFTAPTGTVVYASGNGKVVEADKSNYGYGNIIQIDHGYGYSTIYGHLQKIIVAEGTYVKRGQIIGTVGNTGLSTGSHLHYEVHKNGNRVNPIYYFFNDMNVDDYDKIIKQANYSVANSSR